MYRHPDAPAMLEAAAGFLNDVCAPSLSGRQAFLAKVAANAVMIAVRELELGPAAAVREAALLAGLLDFEGGSLEMLRKEACAAFQTGRLDAETPGALAALAQIAADRVRIEQPRYASLRLAADPSQGVDGSPQSLDETP